MSEIITHNARQRMSCKIHGNVEFIQTGYSKSHWRCIQCRNNTVSENRRKTKQRLVELFGGHCKLCLTIEDYQVFEFHHLDPSNKVFGLSDGNTKAWSKVIEEAKKCIMVCPNCHSKIELGLVSLLRVGSSVV